MFRAILSHLSTLLLLQIDGISQRHLLLCFGIFFPLRQEDPALLVDLAVLEGHVALLGLTKSDVGDNAGRFLLVPDFVGCPETGDHSRFGMRAADGSAAGAKTLFPSAGPVCASGDLSVVPAPSTQLRLSRRRVQ